MSSSLELPHDMVRRILLNLNLLPADPLPARRVERLLRVQTPVNHIHDELHVGLRLHIAAHNPEGTQGFTVLGEETRNNGVIRTLHAGKPIRVLGIKPEIEAAVIKRNPG